MSQIQTTDWSETAASNNVAAPNGWPEGQTAASVNNCAREMESALKIDWNKNHATLSSTGSDPTYVLTYGTAPPAYVHGMRFAFKASFANAGTANANVNALGNKVINKNGAAGLAVLAAGDIQVAHHVTLEYDSAADVLVVITPIAPASASFTGGALTSALNEAKGADIASASTCDIGAATGNYVNITGTTTINAFGTVQAGTRRIVNFNGILTLTYNATSLILPTAASITTAAGDTATMVSLGSGNWICIGYQRASGATLASTGSAVLTVKKQTFTASGTYTPSTGMLYCLIEAVGAGGGGGDGVANNRAAGGGGAGQPSKVLATAATIGASKTVTIGAAGAHSGNGGTTSVGTVCTAAGGSAGSDASSTFANGGLGGTGGTSDIATTGAPGFPGTGTGVTTIAIGGAGGSGPYGGGGRHATGSTGNAATGFGAGGGGATDFGNNGGVGTKGCVYITEWCSQ